MQDEFQLPVETISPTFYYQRSKRIGYWGRIWTYEMMVYDTIALPLGDPLMKNRDDVSVLLHQKNLPTIGKSVEVINPT